MAIFALQENFVRCAIKFLNSQTLSCNVYDLTELIEICASSGVAAKAEDGIGLASGMTAAASFMRHCESIWTH